MIFKKSTLKFLILVLALLLVHLWLLVNSKFTLWPEMVVYPYLLNNGYLLYKDIINPYPPLLTFLLSGFARMVGYYPQPYQILTWIIILLTDLVVFFTSLKLSKNFRWATLSLSFFVLLSIQFGVNGLWFDLVQTPLLIVVFYNFYLFLSNRFPRPKNSGNLIFAQDSLHLQPVRSETHGRRHVYRSFFAQNKKEVNLVFSLIFLIIALLIKQQAVWLMLWFGAVIIYTKRYKSKNFIRGLTPVFLTILLVFGAFFAYFIKLKTYQEFLFWTITFPFAKASSMPGYILLPTLKQLAVVISLFFLISPLVFRKNSSQNLAYLTAIVMVLFAYPRFDYFHLIPSLSMIAVSLGIGISNKFSNSLLIKTLVVLAFVYLIIFSERYFKNNWQKETRFFERDIILASENLLRLTKENALIYIQNGPDQLLALASRLPPKPWVDEFPWYLEQKGLQDQIVLALKQQKPGYVIFKDYEQGNTFDLGVYKPAKIVNYIDSNYKIMTKLQDELWLKVQD